jgi:hypothetical protein
MRRNLSLPVLRLVFTATLGLLITAGCDCGDGKGDPDGGDTNPLCTSLGEACETTAECCTGTCAVGAGSQKTCLDEDLCAADGSCDRAADCCSLSCQDGTCRNDGSLCAVSGSECGQNSDCCSNICDVDTCVAIGGGCSTFGESCSSEGYDGGCCSKYCRNFGSEESPDLRCDRSSVCGARGEICSDASDCCSGVCDGNRCPTQNEVGQKLFAGEPCQKDSDCASYACASSRPGAPKTCQFLGGCRPTGEICSEDWQCCSQHHLTSPECSEEAGYGQGTGCVDHAVEGLATCSDQTAQTGPKEVGEICFDTEGNTVHMCCGECEPSLSGVWRCAGADGFGECRGNGELCSAADQCCSGICRPVETESGTQLQCGACVLDGGLCTTGADCCGFVCTDGVCEETTDPVCLPLGASCTESAECCSELCFDGSCSTFIVPG